MEKIKVKIECPICKKIHEAEIHSVIDIRKEPEMKDRLMKEDIFGFQCPECGFYSDLHYDVLYADPEAKLFIYLSDSPRPSSGGVSEQAQGIDAGGQKEWERIREKAAQKAAGCSEEGAVPQDAVFRLVFTLEDMKEKIRIFDHGLDDRIVEIFKGFSLSQFDYSENYYVTDIRYDLIDGKEFFRIRVSDGTEQYVLDFNGGYEQILNEYIEKIPPMRGSVPVCVDLDNAAALVREGL